MPEMLTRTDWEDVRTALELVPVKARGPAWTKARAMIQAIVDGRNDLAPSLQKDGIHFSVKCELCREFIRPDYDHVYKAVTGIYTHYDCFMKV